MKLYVYIFLLNAGAILLGPVVVQGTDAPEYKSLLKRTRWPGRRVCQGVPVDLLFILDQSTSINMNDRSNFGKELNFMNAIIENMDFENIRVSVIKFSDNAKFEIRFNEYRSRRALRQAINRIKWEGGNTYTDKALYLMLKQGFTAQNGARQGVNKVGVVITDGGSTNPTKTRQMAAEVHRRTGIKMFAIGVGQEYSENKRNNLEELRRIGSDPYRKFVFTVNDTNGLRSIQDKISEEVCTNVPAPPPCHSVTADIVFLLDDSTSINGKEIFRRELSFVSDLVATFDVGPQRVAAISFSTTPNTEFHLDTYGSKSQIQRAIAAIPYTTGDTNMHLAFAKMLNEEFSGPRSRQVVKKIAVVLTDGEATDPYRLEDELKIAKRRGIDIYAIGISEAANKPKLDKIASTPSRFYSFKGDSPDTLSQIRRQMRLRECAQA